MRQEEELLTVKDAAKEKGVHVKSVYRAMAAGRLAWQEQYGVKLIRRGDLHRWKPKGPGPRKTREG
jgi:hypothetical protein